MLYSVFHLDIDNLTLSLLNITLPNLLLQLLPANHSSAVGYGSGRVLAVSDGKFLNDPRGRALARLCVLCLNLMCTARQFPSTAGRFVDSSFCCRLHSVVDGQWNWINFSDISWALTDLSAHQLTFSSGPSGSLCYLDCYNGAYDTPRISTTFGSRSFLYAAPHAWNQLPADIRLISTVSTFKQHLKTHLFNIAYFYWSSSTLFCPLLFSFFILVLLF